MILRHRTDRTARTSRLFNNGAQSDESRNAGLSGRLKVAEYGSAATPRGFRRVDDKMFLPLKDENPLHRIGFQYVTVFLIAACILVWLVQAEGGAAFDSRLVFRLGLIPETILGDRRRDPEMALVTPWLTVFTSMFLHGGFWHLFGNMVYLWVFGDNVEDSMGHLRFACFYLLCGAVAGITHAVADPSSVIPTIGASGAVSGVLGAYFMLYPKRGVWVLVYVMPVRFPAWSVLGVWIGGQLIYALSLGSGGGGVAWYAHIGGFVAGALLVIPMRKPELQIRHLDQVPFGPWSHPRRPRRPKTDPWGKSFPHDDSVDDTTSVDSKDDIQEPGSAYRRGGDSVGPWGKRSRKPGSRLE